MSKYYLTTAIDYSNGEPHIGHAYEKVGADAIARFRRLRGDDVHFLIGMDEHGQNVAQAAERAGRTPQQQVDQIAERFQAVWRALGISNDQFMRTTADAHKSGVRALIKRIFDNNPDDFYEKAYSGWYCVGCESFKQDAEIVDGQCALHRTRKLEWVEERNWFFRLSRYAGFLKKLHTRHLDGAAPPYMAPESRRNEILALIDQGLEDISASRSRFEWGVPFPAPLSNGETQTTYVWFDALPNYLTATGFPAKRYEDRWPAQLHIIGKDITRFHCIIWPAMLQAAEVALPDHVWAHGFVLLGGERFSKSAGVKLDLNEAIHRFGPDAFRYFLLREVPFDTDGSFSWERFEQVYTSELANTWGNLASRTMAMVEKYFDGTVPQSESELESRLDEADRAGIEAYQTAMTGLLLHEGLRQAIASASRGNEFIQVSQPWALAKSPEQRGELAAVLSALARTIARQTAMLYPFMPEKCAEMWRRLGAPGRVEDQRWHSLMRLDAAGWRVTKGDPLFPKPELTAS